MNQIFLSFLTGLTTGGLSCFAVQGGLLAGILSEQKRESQKKSILMFLIAKFIAHFILGGLLGLLGSKFIITSNFQGVMQIISGLFIIIMALKIAGVHPIFRNFSITPPKFIFKIIKNKSRSEASFAPIIIGLLTVLIPCGITQAMMLLSVSSSSFWYGALILGSFILGTTPVFFVLGIASKKILSIKPLKIFAVFVMFYLGLTSINSGQVLRGSAHTLQNYKTVLFGSDENLFDHVSIIENGKQIATINVTNGGYTSSTKALRVGIPVKLTINTKNVQTCARNFVIPALKINKILPVSGSEIIEFTPSDVGKLTYTCSMGMYSGVFNIVK